MIALLLLALGQDDSPPRPPAVVANLEWALGRPVPGLWQSVLIELQNTGARDLDVVAVLEDFQAHTRVTRAETLPASGKRRFHLTIPAGRHEGMSEVGLRILEPGGRQLASQSLAPSMLGSTQALFVAVLSRERGTEGSLRIPRTVGRSTVEVAFPSTRSFPDHWTGLSGLQVLAIHDAPLSELSPDQARALLDYARRGGTVLLAPGPKRDWFSHPVLAALAEISAAEPKASSPPASFEESLGRFPNREPFLLHRFLNGGPTPGFEDKVPEIRSWPCGYGRVTALPADLALPPFAGSAPLEVFWTLLLGNVHNRAFDRGFELGLDPAVIVSRMTSLVNPYPSFLLLAGLTALYLAAVGPLNYLVLRHLRMTILLVVSVPLLSAFFLGVTLGVGYLLKGSSTVVCSTRILNTESGLSAAVETQVATVFSPTSRSYRLSFPRDRSPLPFDRAVENDRERAAPLFAEEGLDRSFTGVSIDQWQTRPYLVQATAELGRGVSFETSAGRLKVVNGSPLAIARGIHYRVKNGAEMSAVAFGPAGPGAGVEVPLSTARWTPVEDLDFGPASLGAAVLEGSFLSNPRWVPEQALGERDFLVCVLADDAPLIEIDSRRPGKTHALSLLIVRKGAP